MKRTATRHRSCRWPSATTALLGLCLLAACSKGGPKSSSETPETSSPPKAPSELAPTNEAPDLSGEVRLPVIDDRLLGPGEKFRRMVDRGEIPAPPTATPTELSELPDVLNGERHVLRFDDLLVGSATRYGNIVDRLYDLWTTDNSTGLLARQFSGQRLTTYTIGTPGTATLVAAGRVFDRPQDTFVTFAQSNLLNDVGFPIPMLQAVFVEDAGTTEYHFAVPSSVPVGEARALAMADFNADGYQDIAFHWGSTESSGSGTMIGTAENLSNVDGGLRFGPQRTAGPAFLDMATGDVDGDGHPELVGLYHTATELRVVIRSVDPTTLAVGDPAGNDFRVADWKAGDRVELAVGKFDQNPQDSEIVVVQAPLGDCDPTFCHAYVRPFDITPSSSGGYAIATIPAVDIGHSLAGTTNLTWKYFTGLSTASGHLDWFDGDERDQLVIAAGLYAGLALPPFNGYSVLVVDFKPGLVVDPAQVAASARTNYNDPRCVADVAVGRFDPPSTDPAGEVPANAQVALLLQQTASGFTPFDCGKDVYGQVAYSAYGLEFENAAPKTAFKLSTVWTGSYTYYSGASVFMRARLAAGDFQGRSLVLGAPMIISVPTNLKPEIVLNAPPMHLDYFTPTFADERPECFAPAAAVVGQEPDSWKDSGLTAAGCLQNVSAYPGHTTGATACDYCAKFTSTSDAEKAGQQEGTASHTWSNEVGGSASWTFGSLTPNFLQRWGLGVEVHGSAKWMSENTVSLRNSTMTRETLSLSTATGPDDYVLYTAQDVYLYMYPVIGKTDDDGNPVYLQFSVPDQTAFHEAEAASLPWWQPAHEIGNLFSYPGNLDQLLSLYPNLEDRSGPFPWTSQVQTTRTVTWTQQQTEEKSVGSSSTMSWDVGGSVSAAAKIRKLHSTVKGEVDYDHHESNSQHYLNTTKKSLTDSQGFTVSTEAFTLISNSTYQAEAHIFGTPTPTVDEGYWDDQVQLPDPDHPGSTDPGTFEPDVHIDGQMQIGYLANMVRTGDFTPGTLWAAQYAKPDIGLQHPKRYHYLGKYGSQFLTDYWSFNPRYATAALDTVNSLEFFVMKGFFINPANVAESVGPQMVMATEGELLRLQARVYNYSLASLPTGAVVKVRFFAHKLAADATNTYNRWTPDGCFVIGEDTVSLGAFRSDPAATAPTNLALATALFDTTGHADEHLVFWVAAWAEDANGNLVAERERHGLTSLPPAGCPAQSILGVPVEFYSNNAGFYDQPFYVIPQSVAAELAAPVSRLARARGQTAEPFAITDFSVSSDNPWAHELWELSVALSAGDQHAQGVLVEFSGEGPGGRVAATRIIPLIRAGTSFVDRVSFRPLRCGPHHAFLTARPGYQSEAQAELHLDIACRPQDVTDYFVATVSDGSLDGEVRVNKQGRVLGKLASLQSALETAQKLAEKGQLKAACQQYARALERTGLADGEAAPLLASMIANARDELGCGTIGGGVRKAR